MQGKIIKGIAGFYYVHVVHSGIYECKAKGIFRNKKIKPLVGDNVEIDIIDEEKRIGNIVEIAERTNELIRPAVANIDQSLVVFAGDGHTEQVLFTVRCAPRQRAHWGLERSTVGTLVL